MWYLLNMLISLPPSVVPSEVSWKLFKCFPLAGELSRMFDRAVSALEMSWPRVLKLATTPSATLISCSADIPQSISSGERDWRMNLLFTSRLAACWHPIRFSKCVMPPRATGRMWSTSKLQIARPHAWEKKWEKLVQKMTKSCNWNTYIQGDDVPPNIELEFGPERVWNFGPGVDPSRCRPHHRPEKIPAVDPEVL